MRRRRSEDRPLQHLLPMTQYGGAAIEEGRIYRAPTQARHKSEAKREPRPDWLRGRVPQREIRRRCRPKGTALQLRNKWQSADLKIGDYNTCFGAAVWVARQSKRAD